jgi:uncharacterized protein with HEPN domain
MRREDEIRIEHILDAADAVHRFVSGRGREALDNDQMLVFAIVRAIEIVGEAASRIGPEARAAFPAIPWSAIVATRNRLIHVYFDVDLEILWRTATAELPALAGQLRAIVRDPRQG